MTHGNDRRAPYLLDITKSELKQPLGLLQAQLADRDATLALMKSINGAMGEAPILTEDRLVRAFDGNWSTLEVKLEEARELAPDDEDDDERSDDDKIGEILDLVRGLSAAMPRIVVDSTSGFTGVSGPTGPTGPSSVLYTLPNGPYWSTSSLGAMLTSGESGPTNRLARIVLNNADNVAARDFSDLALLQVGAGTTPGWLEELEWIGSNEVVAIVAAKSPNDERIAKKNAVDRGFRVTRFQLVPDYSPDDVTPQE